MAKSKRKKDGKSQALAVSKPRTEKLAQRAGKLAAQAERIARDAVDKAMHASSMVVDVLGHPSQIPGAAGSALTAARKTAGEIGDGASDAVDRLTSILDERIRATVSSLGLVTNDDLDALRSRIAALEGKGRKKPAARKAPAKKAAAAKAPAKKVAAKSAPSRTTASKA
jgi:hypothetical protein